MVANGWVQMRQVGSISPEAQEQQGQQGGALPPRRHFGFVGESHQKTLNRSGTRLITLNCVGSL